MRPLVLLAFIMVLLAMFKSVTAPPLGGGTIPAGVAMSEKRPALSYGHAEAASLDRDPVTDALPLKAERGLR